MYNRTRANELRNKRRAANPARTKAERRGWYLRNRESEAAKSAERRAANPAKYLVKKAKTRAIQKGVPFAIDESDVYVPEYCPVLGCRLEPAKGNTAFNSPSLDRTSPPLGYVPGNVVVMSYRANWLKGAASLEELVLLGEYARATLAARKSGK